ncbi:hypothetical protein [Oryza sativa Japonica Group]|uniref:Uncharacterized protein n=1 Tax=Oryza sativa subsp. japonica TaxID=39947 RepID=Q5QMF6_ORYSJ|nr:hypothetical protein [Oryza sativa Japonica Group]
MAALVMRMGEINYGSSARSGGEQWRAKSIGWRADGVATESLRESRSSGEATTATTAALYPVGEVTLGHCAPLPSPIAIEPPPTAPGHPRRGALFLVGVGGVGTKEGRSRHRCRHLRSSTATAALPPSIADPSPASRKSSPDLSNKNDERGATTGGDSPRSCRACRRPPSLPLPPPATSTARGLPPLRRHALTAIFVGGDED